MKLSSIIMNRSTSSNIMEQRVTKLMVTTTSTEVLPIRNWIRNCKRSKILTRPSGLSVTMVSNNFRLTFKRVFV